MSDKAMKDTSGIVALLSDFGDSPYTGIMRAVIKSIEPKLEIVDLDHSIPSFSVTAGAYVLAHSYYWLPRGSVIVAVVDPGVGSGRAALAIETENYVFIGPDNGLLYPAAASDGIKRVYVLKETQVNNQARMTSRSSLKGGVWNISKTFHGRDVFAPAGALVAAGKASLEDLGEACPQERIRRSSIDHVEKINGSSYKAVVVYVDKFGNVALSIRPRRIGVNVNSFKYLLVKTPLASHTVRVGKTFADVSPGEMVAYENSFGHLEVGMNRGNAAKKLGIEIDTKLEIEFLEAFSNTQKQQAHQRLSAYPGEGVGDTAILM